MTASDSAPAPADRPTKRKVRWVFPLVALIMVAAVFFSLVPGSPLYLPDLFIPKVMHQGKRLSEWIKLVDSPDDETRREAIFALGAMGAGAKEGVPALAAILSTDDPNDRVQAALALSKMAPASVVAVPALTDALTDSELRVRWLAALALNRLGADARPAVPALIKGIGDDKHKTNLGKFHGTIQDIFVLTLGRASAGTDEALPTLLPLLGKDTPMALRVAAVRALGDVGEPARAAVPAIKEMLTDRNRALREAAEDALEKIGEKPADNPKEEARLELPDAERALLWKIENRGNELVKHGFGPLSKALKAGDADALLSLLAEDFTGTGLREPAVTRLERGFAEVSRLHETGPPARLSRGDFVARLLEMRKAFALAPPEVQISLKTIRPRQRDRLDGDWEGTAQLRLAGEHTRGAPAEAVALLSFQVPQLTREALARPGWLRGAGIEQFTTARATHYLFAEVAAARGLKPEAFYDNWKKSSFIPATGGAYVTDYNRDGILDVLITDVNRVALYQGRPDGTFEDVTAARGLPREGYHGGAVTWVDADGDGWDDLLLGGRVFRNEQGKRFEDYTRRCNLRLPADAGGVVVADFDRDGKLDLYVTRTGAPGGNSWLDRRSADPLGNRLYRNKGGWQFEDVTTASGAGGDRRSTFTAAWLDANNDGWPDLHVPNEFGDGALLINNRDGTFRPAALADGPADFGTMGLAVGDIDNDGNIDIYCANMFSKAGTRVIGNLKPDAYSPEVMRQLRRFVAGSQLHLNKGGLKFEQVGPAMQVAGVGWAYGTCLADLDNDGWLDIYGTAGYISRSRDEPDG